MKFLWNFKSRDCLDIRCTFKIDKVIARLSSERYLKAWAVGFSMLKMGWFFSFWWRCTCRRIERMGSTGVEPFVVVFFRICWIYFSDSGRKLVHVNIPILYLDHRSLLKKSTPRSILWKQTSPKSWAWLSRVFPPATSLKVVRESSWHLRYLDLVSQSEDGLISTSVIGDQLISTDASWVPCTLRI